MRLQFVKDEPAHDFKICHECCLWSAVVGRRAAELFEVCPDCRGADCDICFGAGLVPVKGKPWDQDRWPYGTTVSFAPLARYLFGGDR